MVLLLPELVLSGRHCAYLHQLLVERRGRIPTSTHSAVLVLQFVLILLLYFLPLVLGGRLAHSTSADFRRSGGALCRPLNLINPWLNLPHSRVPSLSHRSALVIWCHPIGPEMVLAHVLLLVMHHEHVAGVLRATTYTNAAAHGR